MSPARMTMNNEHTLTINVTAQQLRPEHCDRLQEAALQNGDVEMIAVIERARRNFDEAKQQVAQALRQGYRYCNDAPRL